MYSMHPVYKEIAKNPNFISVHSKFHKSQLYRELKEDWVQKKKKKKESWKKRNRPATASQSLDRLVEKLSSSTLSLNLSPYPPSASEMNCSSQNLSYGTISFAFFCSSVEKEWTCLPKCGPCGFPSTQNKKFQDFHIQPKMWPSIAALWFFSGMSQSCSSN